MRRTTSLYVCTALLLGAAYALRPALAPAPAPVVAEAPAAVEGGTDNRAELERMIGAFETQAAQHPNALGLTFLGRLYLQRAKLTGDAGSYGQALTALTAAVTRSPRDPEAQDLLAGARYATHDFRGARALAERVLLGLPGDPGALGVVGDASLELGDDALAARTYAVLAQALPGSPGVLARLSRLAFLHGDVATARRLALQAIPAAQHHGDFGTTLAYYSVLAGRIELDRGHYAAAAAHYRTALKAAPGWHVALAGLARATAARGSYRAAIALYQQAVDVVPQPDYLAALGDLQLLTGQRAAAARSYGTVAVIARLSALNHRLYDRLIAGYDADHNRDLSAALAIATAALHQRADVYGWDVYAWALYRTGHLAAAAQASDRALARHTPDATLLYHAGLIAAALHHDAQAKALLTRALAISPLFDPLQAPRARVALARLP